MSNSTSSSSTYSLDGVDTDKLWAVLGSLGVPSLISFAGAMLLMHLYSWRTTVLGRKLSESLLSEESDSFRSTVLLWLARGILVALPLSLCIAWGHKTASDVDELLGVTIALGFCGIYFLQYGVGR